MKNIQYNAIIDASVLNFYGVSMPELIKNKIKNTLDNISSNTECILFNIKIININN